MAGPFYSAVKGTTAGTPGTGAFTPNAASAGYQAWSTIPTGWWGLVRYDDGSNWELAYSYWNGTTLSRASTQVRASSSGSQITLTSAATAALVEDGEAFPLHQVRFIRGITPLVNSTSLSSFGGVTSTATGTAAAAAIAATNFLTEQPRVQLTSATTANAQAGVSSTVVNSVSSSTAGRGGWEFRCRFGGSTLVTGQRMFAGMTTASQIANTGEPSALAASMAALGKDSTDTNFQFLRKDGTTASKTDSGIAFVANGWYEVAVWSEPGSLTVSFLLVRIDTGAIFYGSSSTNAPVTGSLLMPQCIGGLAATTGTAFVCHFGGLMVRNIF